MIGEHNGRIFRFCEVSIYGMSGITNFLIGLQYITVVQKVFVDTGTDAITSFFWCDIYEIK
jgi:hypothetical protein